MHNHNHLQTSSVAQGFQYHWCSQSGVLSPLFHLDAQQVRLGTAGRFGVIAALLVEEIAALVKCINL